VSVPPTRAALDVAESVESVESSTPQTATAERREAASPAAQLTYRLLNYKDIGEVRRFLTLVHAIGAEADPYYFEKTPELIDRAVIKARREENSSNTFAGLALDRGTMVAVHVLRRFEEGPLIGAQVSGLWVAPTFRRRGIARRLKEMGEAWARSIGAHFLNSNVLSQNAPMLALNRDLGFENYRINLRKRL
jgi:GNAT superfamily N-acetyltransferase